MDVKRIRGTALQRIRANMLRRNPMCAHCHKALATQVDHIIALTNGGTDTRDNRQGLCNACHQLKTADDMGYVRRAGCDESGFPNDPRSNWNHDDGWAGKKSKGN